MTALYDEQLFVDHLQAQLPTYIVSLTNENNFDETSANDQTVRIFFGHLGEHLKNPEAVWADSYRELDNECMVISEIQVCCPRSSFITVINAVKTAYKGWTPFPGDGNYSSMSFLKGAVATYAAGKIWWSEQVMIVTPRIS
jgi:hypothetical protein